MKPIYLTMADNGRLVIPAPLRAHVGLGKGGRVVATVRDGAIVLEPLDVAIRRVQALVRRYVPPGDSLLDDLLAQRRADADGD